jgi:endogenous inhibitor of DNA gyrase (YacG/DUF329 family)
MPEEYQSRYIDVKPGIPVTRRLIHTHERTFTCKQCGQTVTQHHYSGHVFYCSEACRKEVERVQNRKRVKRSRQRKKERATISYGQPHARAIGASPLV